MIYSMGISALGLWLDFDYLTPIAGQHNCFSWDFRKVITFRNTTLPGLTLAILNVCGDKRGARVSLDNDNAERCVPVGYATGKCDDRGWLDITSYVEDMETNDVRPIKVEKQRALWTCSHTWFRSYLTS
jgi:hypothetical protein